MKRTPWWNLFGENDKESEGQEFKEQKFKQCAQITNKHFDESGDFCVIKTMVCKGENASDSFREYVAEHKQESHICNLTYSDNGKEYYECAELPKELIGIFENFDANQ